MKSVKTTGVTSLKSCKNSKMFNTPYYEIFLETKTESSHFVGNQFTVRAWKAGSSLRIDEVQRLRNMCLSINLNKVLP